MNTEIGSGKWNEAKRTPEARWLRKLGTGVAMVAALSLSALAEPGGGTGGPGGPGSLKGGQGHGVRGDGMGMEFNPRMLRELQLSPDQEKKLKEGRLANQKKKIQMHGEKAVLELDLKHVLSTYPVNKAEALKFAGKIAEVDRKILALRIESMVQMLSGLTAEQHAKLMGLQEEWHEKRKAWMDEMRKERKGDKDRKGRDGDGPDDD